MDTRGVRVAWHGAHSSLPYYRQRCALSTSCIIHHLLTMSDLPKYTRVPDEHQAETERLTKGARESFDSDPRGYPPHNAEASSSSGSEHHVTYIYEPRDSNTQQRVLGVLGRSRQVCQ